MTQDARSECRNCFFVFAHGFRFRQTCGSNCAIENLSGQNLASGQTALLFHVKQSAENLRVVPLKCAIESPPEAAELVLRMFRLHVGDQAGLASCSGSSDLQSVQVRGDRLLFRLHPARPAPIPFPNPKTAFLCYPNTRKRLPYPFENSSNIAPSSFLVGSLPCSQYMTPARSFSRA